MLPSGRKSPMLTHVACSRRWRLVLLCGVGDTGPSLSDWFGIRVERYRHNWLRQTFAALHTYALHVRSKRGCGPRAALSPLPALPASWPRGAPSLKKARPTRRSCLQQEMRLRMERKIDAARLADGRHRVCSMVPVHSCDSRVPPASSTLSTPHSRPPAHAPLVCVVCAQAPC